MDPTAPIDLSGKVAFVTGATSGIGRATALAFARAGAAVVATDSVEQTVRSITDGGGHAISVTCDVTDSAAVERALAAAVEAFGASTWRSTTPGSTSPSPRPPTSPTRTSTDSSRSTCAGSSCA